MFGLTKGTMSMLSYFSMHKPFSKTLSLTVHHPTELHIQTFILFGSVGKSLGGRFYKGA